MKVEKWIVFTDVHLPYMDMKSVGAMEKFMADNTFDGWLCLGDLLDFNEISRFNEEFPRRKKELVYQTFEAGNKFLDRHQEIIRANNKKARFVYLEGNHEHRVTDYMDKHPELSGLLDVDRNLNLDQRGIEWIPSWSRGLVFTLGNANFVHGLYTNQYHSAKMANAFGRCIYYGHLHDVQESSIVQYGNNKTIVGKSLGCLCDYNQTYLKGNPTKWQHAFSVFHIFPDGYYTEHTIRIFKNRFTDLNGMVYS